MPSPKDTKVAEEKKRQPDQTTESRDDSRDGEKFTFRRRPANEIADPKFKPPKAQKSRDTDAKESDK